jgi:GLPGLI family protein
MHLFNKSFPMVIQNTSIMKKMAFILVVFSTLLLRVAYAQEPDKTLVKVRYTFIHVQDTTQRAKPYIENMLLLAGKNASLYTSYDDMAQTVRARLEREEMEKSGFSGDAINAKYRSQQRQQFSSTTYYFFAGEHKFFYRSDICVGGCLVEGETEKIDWKITKDTLNIAGIHCTKAAARFKGRNWIAWFDADLPLTCGPWKLNGLPGLIIEAYAEKKEVQFKFAGLENVKDGDLSVEDAHKLSEHDLTRTKIFVDGLDESYVGLPTKTQVQEGGPLQVTEKEFEKLKAEYDKDPVAFTNAQLIARGYGKKANVTAMPPAPKNVVNNPIELLEKNK